MKNPKSKLIKKDRPSHDLVRIAYTYHDKPPLTRLWMESKDDIYFRSYTIHLGNDGDALCRIVRSRLMVVNERQNRTLEYFIQVLLGQIHESKNSLYEYRLSRLKIH